MAPIPLRVLIVEDSPADAQIELHELKRGGFALDSLCVDTESAYLAAIEGRTWDVILSDFSMPKFNGMAAFDLLIKKGLDVPFIFVSGRIGEDQAAEAMRRGAKDYVLKDNLKRLVPAVSRELNDVAERRKRRASEDALRESDKKLRSNERLLETVFDTIPVRLAVKDTESRYLKVNRAWCERFGLTPEQVIGKKGEAIPSRLDEDKQQTLEQDQRTLASGGRILQFESWDTASSGERRHSQSFRAPLRDEQGQVIGLVGASVDLTDLKRAEEALRLKVQELESANLALQALQLKLHSEIAERTLAETRFRQLVELAPQAIVAVGADARIVFVNAEALAMFGYTEFEMIGQPVEILVPERYRAKHPDQVRAYFENPEKGRVHTGLDLNAVRKDGSEFPVDIRLGAITTSEGKQVIASVSDVSAFKNAEAKLLESQQLLHTVFDTIPHMLIVKNLKSRILMVNKAWSHNHGVAADEVVNTHTLDLPHIPEAEKRIFLEEDRKVFSGDGTYEAGERLITIKGGLQVPFHSYKSPLYDANGTIIGLVGVFVDISDRVRAENKLRASERLLQTVFDTIPHLLTVRDAEGRHQIVNKAWSEFHGLPQEKALGRTVLDFTRLPASETRASFEADQQVLANPSLSARRERVMTSHLGKEANFLSIRTALRDERGQAVGVVAIQVDVTAEKEAQHKAELAHARLMDAIEGLPGAFFLFDVDERLVLWNSRVKEYFFTGVYERLSPGMRFEEVLRLAAASIHESEGNADQWIERRLAEFRSNSGSYEEHLADGRWLRILDRRTSDGGSVCLRFDVTEYKRQDEMLRQSQKLEAIGSLAGGISHDFNNLLTVIGSQAEFILDAAGGPGPIRDDAQIILDAGARAAALTRQLLAFGRKQVLQMRVLDINSVVGNLEKMLHRLIGEDIELGSKYSPNVGKILADPIQIEQIVLNLTVNARDAMPKGGKLSIETASRTLDRGDSERRPEIKPGDYVMLAVSDNGHGMDQATQARIFEPFFTTKPLGKGTGMGLATVYGIVKQMNGSVFVYSELGKGTTFKIYFPVSADAPTAVSAPPSRPRPAGATETVLLVEDEEMVRKSVARMLAAAGYSVLVANGADEALKLVLERGASINLLLSDVVMPGLSGRELWDRIRETLPIRVLFMSGYTDDAIVRHGILEGNVPFINKPFSSQALLDKVRDVLDSPTPTGVAAH